MEPKESFLDIISEYLNSEETRLPVFDKSVLGIQEEIAKEDPDLDSIEKLIDLDPSLTAQVLRSANSDFYKGLTKVSTVKKAIIRLGTGAISNIVNVLVSEANGRLEDSFCSGMTEKLWQHAMGCAIGTRWLATQLHFDLLADEAFTAGLLHDIGKLLIVTVVESLIQSGKTNLRPSDLLLNEVMDNFHSEYGYLLLKNWNLPASYCTVAKAHHSDELDSNDILLIMVRLVNRTCNKLGIGLKEDPSIILAATQEANLLGVSEVLLAQLEITLEDALLFNTEAKP